MSDRTSDAVKILDSEFGDDPEYREMLTEELVISRASKAVYEARKSGDLTQEELTKDTPSARVNALLRRWQQEYGLPPRPDGKTHTSVAELFAEWEAEDASLTPEEIATERRLWEESQEHHQGVTIRMP